MGDLKSWRCSVCGHHATISDADRSSGTMHLLTASAKDQTKAIGVTGSLIRCPNPSCHQLHLAVSAWPSKELPTTTGSWKWAFDKDGPKVGVGQFQFLPTTASPLSGTVPHSVSEDYQEAYLIRALSPKAAATLARRALQGMIRDFWGVSLRTLHEELKAIQARCDPALYEAMMAVKSIGNIGAHPERDVALIVDIEAGEAEELLQLIHLLDREWYVERANRAARLENVRKLAAKKADEQTP